MTGIVASVALSASLIVTATGGRLVAGAATELFEGVSIDSRTLPAGALFVALPTSTATTSSARRTAAATRACSWKPTPGVGFRHP